MPDYANSNPYRTVQPFPQCTYWAAERWYQLTGHYPPDWGNANTWPENAQKDGWTVTDKPIVPSICVLGPGVQDADKGVGHVCIVEDFVFQGAGLLSDTFMTSNMNWPEGSATVKDVPHTSGQGVYFITDNSPVTLKGKTIGYMNKVANQQLHGDGSWYGVCKNLHDLETFTDTSKIDFSNPVNFAESVASNIAQSDIPGGPALTFAIVNAGAIFYRAFLIIMGMVILFAVGLQVQEMVDSQEIGTLTGGGGDTANLAEAGGKVAELAAL